MLALALLALAGFAPAAADEALWARLRQGGNVILMRHASTEPGIGDPPGYVLSDCATQRNLSAVGREEARRVGEALRNRGVPVGEVLSSRWCRCLETARLAFGRAEPWPQLDSFFDTPERKAAQTAALRERVGKPVARGNSVLVTHSVNIAALTGASVAQGELLVLAADGRGGFSVLGRISPQELGRQ